MAKSANQLWKESGTTLSFAEWIQREKDKGLSITNKLLEGVVAPFKEDDSNSGNDKLIPSKSSLGMPNWVLITGVSIIGIAIFYKYYTAKK